MTTLTTKLVLTNVFFFYVVFFVVVQFLGVSGRRVGGLVHVVDAVEETRALKSTSSSVLDEGLRRRALLQDGDDEPEKDVKARLGDLLPVKGTKTNFERGSGQTNKPKTPTTGGGNKHSLLHANVVGAHTPTAQTKDEIIVEKVIEKQSEENTDAESSEAIVAADVSKEAPATKEEVTSEDEDAEDIAEEEKEKRIRNTHRRMRKSWRWKRPRRMRLRTR